MRIFASMTLIRLMTYRSGSVLPPLPEQTLTHSTELFKVYEQTPGYEPILLVAFVEDRPVAKLLAVIRRSVRLFPPSLIKRCEVYGTGEYFDETINQEELFGVMLEHLTREALRQSFLIEFRNLPTALSGYKYFRNNKYFPIHWLRVYNSLHSLPPYERLDTSRRRQINRALKRGVTVQVAETEADIHTFLQMLKKNYASKVRKHFPDLRLFRLLLQRPSDKERARIFLVKYKGKIIGGSFCMFSDGNAYLCFSAGMRKTYPRLYPGVMAVWAAITYAHEHHYQHFEFVDAGLPFKKIGYRNFILRFGGKQVSTRRWFRFRWEWLNRLAGWLYL